MLYGVRNFNQDIREWIKHTNYTIDSIYNIT
jgi:hypothetical protein